MGLETAGFWHPVRLWRYSLRHHTSADEHVLALAGGPRPECFCRKAARKRDQYKFGGDSQDVPRVEGTDQAGELSFTL